MELDESSDQISSQIKRAQEDKLPWMLVIGQKEVDNNTITLRYNSGKQEFGLSYEQLIAKAQDPASAYPGLPARQATAGKP